MYDYLGNIIIGHNYLQALQAQPASGLHEETLIYYLQAWVSYYNMLLYSDFLQA